MEGGRRGRGEVRWMRAGSSWCRSVLCQAEHWRRCWPRTARAPAQRAPLTFTSGVIRPASAALRLPPTSALSARAGEGGHDCGAGAAPEQASVQARAAAAELSARLTSLTATWHTPEAKAWASSAVGKATAMLEPQAARCSWESSRSCKGVEERGLGGGGCEQG